MSSAQKTLTASGSYTYYAPMNITPEQAELTAIERAKIEAIEKAFGRVVGVRNYTEIVNAGEMSSSKFLSLGESEVRGEWLETIGKPEIQHEFDNNLQIVTVTITGRIREVKAAKVDFDAKVLRNGTTDRYESSEFRDGDDLFVSFRAPVDGFLAVYLYNLSGVSRLLPLKHSTSHSAYFVPADTKQVLFTMRGTDKSIYAMTCDGDSELNRIYILFSPNKFTIANDFVPDDVTAPANVDFDGFQKWLSRCRKWDKDFSMKILDIMIRK